VDGFVEKYRAELNKLRTITLGDFKHESAGRADFFVVLGKGTSSAPTVQGVKFVSGDETLKTIADIAGAANTNNFSRRHASDAFVSWNACLQGQCAVHLFACSPGGCKFG
jgi:hypothetical protein